MILIWLYDLGLRKRNADPRATSSLLGPVLSAYVLARPARQRSWASQKE